MATALFPSPIFGPVHSRRLGTSLGINLLPENEKVCSFDCIYCECGLNQKVSGKPKLPSREEVKTTLEKKLQYLTQKGITPDVFTFAGNGEPTSHPQFPQIIDDTIALRDRYFPNAKISVLSNSTFLKRPEVFEALKKADNAIMKLDTVNPDFINRVDRPNAHYDVDTIVEQLKAFGGDVVIQTMFLKGQTSEGEINNTTDAFVDPWLAAIERIKPREIMIYTLDRPVPVKGLFKANKEELDRIRDKIVSKGYQVSVAY